MSKSASKTTAVEARDAIADPWKGDVWLLKESPIPAVVHEKSLDANSIRLQHDGTMMDRPLQYWPSIVDGAELIRAMPPVTPAEPISDVPGVTLDPVSATAPAEGGTGSFTVTITSPGTSGTWILEPESSATWLVFGPLEPQAASGTANWTATANDTGMPRTGHAYVNGKTFTLDQAAAPAGDAPSAETASHEKKGMFGRSKG